MKKSFALGTSLIFLIISGALSIPVQANLISNGSFEAGFSGWTVANQFGSEGSFFLQTGTASPVIGEPVPAPTDGATAAMTDAEGPGAHVLYQTFVATAPVSSMRLDFDLFIGNRADAFYVPETLDFATPALNQQARVDILVGAADPFSLDPADLLLNVFQTSPGDPLVAGYNHYSVDITSLLNAHLNEPLMLRFAETDNVFIFQLGVDNVSIQSPASVPDSSLGGLEVLVLFGLCWFGRRAAV